MSKKALLGVVLPFISNPVVLAAVGIGAVGYTVYDLLSNKNEEQDNGSDAVTDGSEPFDEPLDAEASTATETIYLDWGTVEATAEETDKSSVEESYISRAFGSLDDAPQQDNAVSDEAFKKEMIRQAMSELGKRSAAARAKKKGTN